MLTTNDVYKILRQILPEQNDFYVSDYVEELQELFDFDITKQMQLLDLISKHKDAVLSIDSEHLDEFHIQHYNKELGKGFINERREKSFWFAFPALL